MVTIFVQGLWRALSPEGCRSVDRGPSPRRRRPSRVIESLEDRVLLSADVESARPPAIVEFIQISSPPPQDDAGAVEADGGEAAEDGSPSPPPIWDEPPPEEESATIEEPPVEEGPWGPPAPSPVADSWMWGPVWGRSSGSASNSHMLVRDDLGNEVSSSWPRASAISMTPELLTDPDSFGYGPMPAVVPPSLAELAQIPKLSWSANQSVTGSVDGQNATVVRIPVGPSTQTLTLGLKPEQPGSGTYPRIDQVFLLGRHGEVLTSVVGVSFMGDDFEQKLYLAIHGAPIGGEVVVRMVTTSPSAPLETGGPIDGAGDGTGDGQDGNDNGDSGPPAWEPTYFELSVQRTDSKAPPINNNKSENFAPGAGAVTLVTIGRGDTVTAIGSLAPTPEPTVESSERGPTARVAASAGTRAEADLDLADDGPVEVYLGPLVSRTAAAFGPALATAAEEATTSTDRGGPQPGGVDAFGADMDLEMILAIRARGESGDAASATDADPALTTLRGPGGVPIVVAGLRSGDRDRDADDLAASVVGSGDDATMLAEALELDAPLDGSEPEVARAGLATRAVGFLIGMGLASGPLYPDLVALARKKLRLKPRRAGRRRSRPA